tara:strand:- start:201 stop:359 length:159 start_codon:yes stop_codon:yes gene_type:complete
MGVFSMGAGGTFCYALYCPDLFSAACPLSGLSSKPTIELGGILIWLEITTSP